MWKGSGVGVSGKRWLGLEHAFVNAAGETQRKVSGEMGDGRRQSAWQPPEGDRTQSRGGAGGAQPSCNGRKALRGEGGRRCSRAGSALAFLSSLSNRKPPVPRERAEVQGNRRDR